MCGTVTWVLINVTRGWVLPGGQVALLDGSGGESDGVPRGLVPTGPRLDDMDAGSGCQLVTGVILIYSFVQYCYDHVVIVNNTQL